jgi:hypothetical protein
MGAQLRSEKRGNSPEIPAVSCPLWMPIFNSTRAPESHFITATPRSNSMANAIATQDGDSLVSGAFEMSRRETRWRAQKVKNVTLRRGGGVVRRK